MDLELRAYLDNMRAEMATVIREEVTAVRKEAAETRKALESKIDDAHRETAETREALESKIDDARREAGAMFESMVHEIKALPEGLSTFQRQEARRLDAEREEAMLNRHVLPLEASAADHEKRLKAVEKRR